MGEFCQKNDQIDSKRDFVELFAESGKLNVHDLHTTKEKELKKKIILQELVRLYFVNSFD